MSAYLNAGCPCCGRPVTKEDELVVCPVCGTPHHRACYFERGECYNQSRHEEGYEWVAPAAGKTEQGLVSSEPGGVVCRRCGRQNNGRSAFCNYCGTALGSGADAAAESRQFPVPFFQAAEEQSYYSVTEEIDGISVKDWMLYIGQNFQYYLYCFKAQDRTEKKTAFTLSAMFFPFVYFIYRRVWWAAAVSAMTGFLLNVPYIVSTALLPAGIDFGVRVSFWETASGVCSLLNVGVNLLWGLLAVWFFRKKAAKVLARFREQSVTDGEYAERLRKASGPSRTAIMVLALSFAAFSFLVGMAAVLFNYSL